MAERKNAGYKKLQKDINAGDVGNMYIFHGEEKYLQEYYLNKLRKMLVTDGMEEFNLKTFSASGFDINLFDEALNALPVMSEKTLIEIHDYSIFKAPEDTRKRFLELLEDMPEYACVVMSFDTIEFAVDKRLKHNSKLLGLFQTVEFEIQQQSELVGGIKRRYKALGKEIDTQTAEYLAFITGGLMTRIISEIEKTAAYTAGSVITKDCIDAVTIPVLDAAAYKLTDALLQRRYDAAAGILDTLLAMQEAAHRILFSVSMKYRQLMIAKACRESGKNVRELMDMCGIRYEFQARGLWDTAAKVTMEQCCQYVKLCSDAALRLNSGEEAKAVLAGLLIELTYSGGRAGVRNDAKR